MRKKILLTLNILFAIYTNSFSQGVELGFQVGYGFYNMKTIKDISDETFERLPFNAKIISNCPPYFYFQPRINFPSKDFSISLLYTFQSTGGRISSIDYSGEYKFDTRISCHSPGAMLTIYVFKNKYIVGIYSEIGMNLTAFKFNEHLKVDTVINNQEYSFKSRSLYFKPGINVIYPIDRFRFEFNVGFLKEFFRSDFSKKNEFDVWDGARIGLTISYNLSNKH